jgi:tetratricopeptide (TPR) repeat protein
MTLDSDSSSSSGPTASRGRWLVVAIAIGLVLVPWLWTAIPAEIARWYCAAAAEAELADATADALQRVNQAIRWNPREPNLLAYRADLLLKRKDVDGALNDADRAVQLAQGNSPYAFYQRILVHQRRGDHQEALRDVDRLLELASDGLEPELLPTGEILDLDYDELLNLRAYSRALAERDIQPALRDIDEAFRRAGSEDIAAYLDTRGYLYYLAGDLTAAEGDLQRAVELAEKALDLLKPVDPEESKLTGRDALIRQQRQRALQQALAVMLHHRGLVHDALGRKEQAEEDLRRADQLGYSPEDGVW